jgi:hypothetical protein
MLTKLSMILCSCTPTNHCRDEPPERVWVSLERREFAKKYGRSRRKIFWQIYTETKAGRGSQSLALQFLMPLQAFASFADPAVLVEFVPERVFLERKNYETFAKREIARVCGEEFLTSLALEVVAPNKSLDRSGSVFRIKPGAAKVE